MSALIPIAFGADTYLLVLTGAGVSAESGVPTFRDAGGLWEKYPVEQVASPEGFRRDPALVWRFYSERRARAKSVRPNEGHHAIARVERRLGDRFLLVTQNVDGLHRQAGTERVVEMHGNLLRTRCSRCDRPAFEDATVYDAGTVPACDACGSRSAAFLRPDIVWFGEMIAPSDLSRIERFTYHATRAGRLVFVAAGTSGTVYPAAAMVDDARALGADTWLVNAEPASNGARFAHFVQGRSGEILPVLFGEREGDGEEGVAGR